MSRLHYSDLVEASGYGKIQAGIGTGLAGSGIAKVGLADTDSEPVVVGHAGTSPGCSKAGTDYHDTGSGHPEPSADMTSNL